MIQASPEFIEAMKQPIKDVYIKLEFYTSDMQFLGEFTKKVSKSDIGSINVDRNRPIRRSFTLTLDNKNNEFIWGENSLVWIDKRIKLFTGLKIADGSIHYVPQGLFVLTEPSDLHRIGDGKKAIINCVDKAYLYTDKRGKLVNELIIEEGTPVKIAIQLLFEDAGETMFNFDDDIDAVVPYEISFSGADNIWKVGEELAIFAQADLFYDVYGYLRLKKIDLNNLWLSPPTWIYKYGDKTDRFYAGNVRRFDDNILANHIRVLGGSSQTAEVLFDLKVEKAKYLKALDIEENWEQGRLHHVASVNNSLELDKYEIIGTEIVTTFNYEESGEDFEEGELDGVVVGEDGLELEEEEDAFAKFDDPSSLPTDTGRGAAFSPDGTYLAVAHNASPYITIYKRNGDTFTKLSDPSSLPTSNGYGAAFSPDGTYLAVAHANSPRITIYKRNGDTFTKLSDPSSLPTSNGYGAAFSPDGTYLAVAHLTSPYITIYKRNGDTFTKLSDPSSLPTSNGLGAAFSPDGTYLAVAHANSPYITIYKRNGDTFTKLSDPSSLPTGSGYGAAFSPDGTYLAVAHNASPYITIYKRNGDTFTKLSNPSSLPTGTGYGATFSPDGTYLAVAHLTSPRITIYKRNGDTFTKLSNPSSLPTGSGYGAAFSPDGTYLAVAHYASPYITIYKHGFTESGSRISPPLDLSGAGTVKTSEISWQATEPTDTSLKVETSLSTDSGQTWSAWQEVINGNSIPGINIDDDLTGKYLKVRQKLITNDSIITPKLHLFNITIKSERNIIITIYYNEGWRISPPISINGVIDSEISWEKDVPENTNIIIEFAISENGEIPPNNEDFLPIENSGSSIPGIIEINEGKYLWLRQKLITLDNLITPKLHNLLIKLTCDAFSNNPYYIEKIGQWTYFHNNNSPDPLITTYSEAFWRAKYELMNRLGYTERTSIQIAPNYLHDASDIIEIIDDENKVNGRYLIESFNLPIVPDLVTVECRKEQRIVDNWDFIKTQHGDIKGIIKSNSENNYTNEEVGFGDGYTRHFQLDYFPVKEESVKIYINGIKVDSSNYIVHYHSGVISFKSDSIPGENKAITADYTQIVLLEGVKLQLSSVSTEYTDETYSNFFGNYRFIKVPEADDYIITANLEGYQEKIQSNVEVVGGDIVSVDLEMVTSQLPHPIEGGACKNSS